MTTTILVPVLGRPHRVKPLLDSIKANTPDPFRVLFVCSPGDTEEEREIDRAGAKRITVDGGYARKINVGALVTTEPILFLGADDLHFHPGWFEAASSRLSPLVGVVGTNDLGSPRVIAGEHSTHSLVARWYADLGTIDEPGKLLHEGYLHEWVDDEFVATAKHRGMYAHAPDSLVEHLHPNWGKAPTDSLYDGQRHRIRRGRRIFNRRQPLWT